VRRAAREKGDAEALARQFEGVTVTFQRRAGEHDQLFGSVTPSEIAAALEQKGLHVDRRKIHVDQPIKTLGEFTVPIRLHKEVTASVKVFVEREAAPAEEAAAEEETA
jgi:large subunit ribosomal protein L9